MKSLFKAFLIILFSVSLLSCSEDETSVTNIEDKDDMAVNIGNDSYSVAATTSDYNYNDSSYVFFSKNNITASISVVGMKQGKVTLTVLGQNRTLLYSKTISSQISATNENFSGIPSKVFLKLENFTGQLAINLKGQ
ncbi:MAG: hypothetical protein RBS48_10690 [Ignavibacteriaceae bacterium]|jgi:hypothetical protein|nr:hypothetical protein [Ignavibacteriaceae bacterium]